MSVHYVTHIKVERVEVTEPARLRGSSYINTTNSSATPAPQRTVTEAGSVTVKAPSLAKLSDKIAAHVALFDDEPDAA